MKYSPAKSMKEKNTAGELQSMKSRLNTTIVIIHTVQWSNVKTLAISWTQLLKVHCAFSHMPINCQADSTSFPVS